MLCEAARHASGPFVYAAATPLGIAMRYQPADSRPLFRCLLLGGVK